MSTSTQQNPQFTFPATGTYTVTFEITTVGGKIKSVEQDIDVFQQSDVSFSYEADCLEVTFTDTSTAPNIVEWTWDFGDYSLRSHVQNPVHTYIEPGLYVVTLTIQTLNLSVATVQDLSVVVGGDIEAFFSFLVDNLDVAFTDESVPTDSTVDSWEWDFGDETSHNTAQNPSHTYAEAGTYLVTLYATNSCGLTDSYSFPVSVVEDEEAEWTHTFDFTEDDWLFTGDEWESGIGWIGQQVLNYVPPGHLCTSVYNDFIERTFTDTTITGASITFQIIGTRNVQCFYELHTKKDTVGTEDITFSNFHTAGEYTQGFSIVDPVEADEIRVGINYGSVTPDFGADCSDAGVHIKSLTLSGTGTNPFNQPNFSYTSDGLDVDFIDESIVIGEITAWEWDFGDTGTSTLQNPSHTYSSPDTYTVSLTITVNGHQKSVSQEITVPQAWTHTFDFTVDNGGWATGYATGAVGSYNSSGWNDADYTPGGSSDGWRAILIRKDAFTSSELLSVRVIGTYTPGTFYTSTFGFVLYFTASGGSPVESILSGSMPSGTFDHTWSGDELGVTSMRVSMFSDLDTSSPYVFNGDILITSIIVTGTGSDPF